MQKKTYPFIQFKILKIKKFKLNFFTIYLQRIFKFEKLEIKQSVF